MHGKRFITLLHSTASNAHVFTHNVECSSSFGLRYSRELAATEAFQEYLEAEYHPGTQLQVGAARWREEAAEWGRGLASQELFAMGGGVSQTRVVCIWEWQLACRESLLWNNRL